MPSRIRICERADGIVKPRRTEHLRFTEGGLKTKASNVNHGGLENRVFPVSSNSALDRILPWRISARSRGLLIALGAALLFRLGFGLSTPFWSDDYDPRQIYLIGLKFYT